MELSSRINFIVNGFFGFNVDGLKGWLAEVSGYP